MSFGAAPTVPAALQVYNSYLIDPQWQTKFSIIWASCLGAVILVSAPRLVKSIRNGRAFTGFFGVKEDWSQGGKYEVVDPNVSRPPNPPKARSLLSSYIRKIEGLSSAMTSMALWTLPGLGLNFGQIFVILTYLIIVLICIIMGAQLVNNSNRAGFMALAQLPVVFLFATKNSIVSLLLGPGHGYEKLNYIHRWSARCLFLGAVVHGSLWIRNHLQYDILIIGSQKETSGVAALGVLCGIVLTSIKPVRKQLWGFFWVVHVLGFVAFFITICYHTIYAIPWIFPPLAFYAADMFMRMLRVRIKDAGLTAVDSNMTLVRVQDCDSNWIAGQHVRLRVFFSGRVFESHPLTIMNAPSDITCLVSSSSNESSRGIILGARVAGDWTRALNKYAEAEGKILQANDALWVAEKKDNNQSTSEDDNSSSISAPRATRPEVPIQVMMDGPYGGCSVDLGQYETALLIAGGSGATFTIGVLDDIVGRCIRLGRPNGEKTRRIEFVWCLRSYGTMQWFASVLIPIANLVAERGKDVGLDLHVSVYVTCLCNPEAVPVIPNSDVLMLAQRPRTGEILDDLLTEPLGNRCCCAGECACAGDCDGKESRGLSSGAPSSAASIDNVSIAEVPRKKFGNVGDPEACPALAKASAKLEWVGLGGGVAICASGPSSLTREASNATARLSLLRGMELGGVGLHTEMFSV
ncbi:hypothetical protein D9757_012517 [Collybiopsis confluens]|uniref:FAD-binding FR-type domain-containing protein n=1 Tax=Collybiopsis confluens TaxID=2823264 RepID=A0A8H5D4S3_9AGAR|nr:hypothetical protein D9757_012517 [Collybiopsis confluens]